MTKVFITGATGFIGGTVLQQLISEHPDFAVTALVRDAEKSAKVTAKFPNVTTVIGDLDSTELLETESGLADIVINTADCDHVSSANAIISGIEKSGGGYLIHTSGVGLLFDKPDGNILAEKVWDDIADLEELSSFPETAIHRPVEKIVLEAPPSVRTAIISPGKVYGVGTGPSKLYTIPILTNTMLDFGYAFQVGTGAARMASIHVRDLARIFTLLVAEALKPNGGAAQWDAEGYYFGQSDEISAGDHAKIIGEELARLGKIPSAEVRPCSIAELEKIHPFYPYGFASNARCVGSRARKLGWAPTEDDVYAALPKDIRAEVSTGEVRSWEVPAQVSAALGTAARLRK